MKGEGREGRWDSWLEDGDSVEDQKMQPGATGWGTSRDWHGQGHGLGWSVGSQLECFWPGKHQGQEDLHLCRKYQGGVPCMKCGQWLMAKKVVRTRLGGIGCWTGRGDLPGGRSGVCWPSQVQRGLNGNGREWGDYHGGGHKFGPETVSRRDGRAK